MAGDLFEPPEGYYIGSRCTKKEIKMTTEVREARPSTSLELVPGKPEHVGEIGRICYEAFKDIADSHGFPPDFPSAGFARQVTGMLVERDDFYSVTALMDGQPVGSNFLSLSDAVAGVGPITIEVPLQGQNIGRALMEDVVNYGRRNGIERIRLQQDGFNMASLSLYASLGFEQKDACVVLQPSPASNPDESVRPLGEVDLPACEELSRRIHGISRRNELAATVRWEFPCFVREREGRIVAYLIPILFGHGVAETEEDLVALVTQAGRMLPAEAARVICPLSEAGLYTKLLKAGCRAIKLMNLMAIGPYEPPSGVWTPSVLY